MLTQYKVREGFHLHHKKSGEILKPGTVVDLTEAEAQDHILQIEEVQVEKARAESRRNKQKEAKPSQDEPDQNQQDLIQNQGSD